MREVKAARDTIKLKEDQVLNYFVERSTNASAESFNSKVKNFRAQLHGVLDVKFFMYRLGCIFGYPYPRNYAGTPIIRFNLRCKGNIQVGKIIAQTKSFFLKIS